MLDIREEEIHMYSDCFKISVYISVHIPIYMYNIIVYIYLYYA